jgi:uncharacterized phage-like protein YoqJ
MKTSNDLILNTCCFTGHRPQNFNFKFNEESNNYLKIKDLLQKIITKLIEDYHVTHFISGMALGIDQLAAEIILELKKFYSQISLECAIPCETQAINWTENQRNKYFSIVEHCDKETLLQYKYTNDCMQKRNEYMVKNSNYLVAVWDGRLSGTSKTISYAKFSKKSTIIINPITLGIISNFKM